MNFENIKSDGMSLEYKVTFSAEEIESDIEKAIEKRAKIFKMQGFRQGHVPLHIVRSNVENSVIKDVLDNLISEACKSVIKEAKVKDLASKPTYKFENRYEKGKDLSLTISIETAPSFELRPYEMEITKVLPKVSEKEIEEAIKVLMLTYPIYEKAELGYKVKSKDEVSYKADCYNKGVESKKKSFANKVIIPDVIPEDAEFLKNFVGKKVGESFDFVPATDKNLTYKITIKSIKKALTDLPVEEFAKKRNFKDIKEMQSAVKQELETGINNQAFIYHKNQILEKLEKEYKFDLPQGILDKEMNAVLNNVKQEAEATAKKAGKKPEIKSDEELRKEYADVVRKRVLLGYVLNKIAKEEKITATDKEVQQAILAEINRNPNMAQFIVDYYSKNPEALAYKKAEIIEYKVVSFLISKAKTKEVEKTKKEIDEIVNKLLED